MARVSRCGTCISSPLHIARACPIWRARGWRGQAPRQPGQVRKEAAVTNPVWVVVQSLTPPPPCRTSPLAAEGFDARQIAAAPCSGATRSPYEDAAYFRIRRGTAMDLRFDDKTIIVTGGGSGIGAATAEELAASGATVIVADLDLAHAESVATGITTQGGRAHAVQVDVADAEAVAAMVRFAVERGGALHGIVNNAGIGGPSAPTGSYDL